MIQIQFSLLEVNKDIIFQGVTLLAVRVVPLTKHGLVRPAYISSEMKIQSQKRFFFHILVNPNNNFKAKEGPPLIQARAYHCSAVMEIRGEKHIVVAGGDGNSYLDTVELLNPNSADGWKKGKKSV